LKLRTGAQWKWFFGGEYEELFLRYRVKFEDGFDFVRGGKLPGLAGGTAPTGNAPADGFNGWTGRLMWRTDFQGVSGDPQQLVSQAISYAKYTDSGFDMDGRDEDREYWVDDAGDRIQIDADRWYEIRQRVKMNTPGQPDGILQIWLDGQLVHDQQDVLFRFTDELKIDQMYFSTFFGGGSSWKTSKDETIFFDDFVVYEQSEPQTLNVPGDYDTIQAAIDAASPGDTVFVSGVHVGNVMIDKAILLQGSPDARLAAANKNQPAIRVTAPGVQIKQLLTVRGTHGVLVDEGNPNVVIDSVRTFQTTSIAIRLQPGCHGGEISNCVINQTTSGYGIIVSQSDDVEVINNRVLTVPIIAFSLADSDGCTLEGNLAVNSTHGFSIRGSRNEVINNQSVENSGRGFVVVGNENTVLNNLSRSNGSHAFIFFAASNNIVAENKSVFDGGTGYQFQLGSDFNTVVGNSARLDGGNGFVVDASSDNLFDDNWADDNFNGFVFTSSTESNSIINGLSEDNANFGILDVGNNNSFSGNVVRRNRINQ